MPQPQKKSTGTQKLRANEQKWGSALVDAGWTLIPSTILEQQQVLGLDPVDLNILLQLARHWWQKDNPPHPAIKTISECIGKSVSTVQRRLKQMESEGIIEIEHRYDKHGGQTSSNYYFTGLIEKGTELAREAIRDREQNRRKTAARRRKGLSTNITLKVVK